MNYVRLAVLALQAAMKFVAWVETHHVKSEAQREIIDRAKEDARVQIQAAKAARNSVRARFDADPDELRKPDEFVRPD